MSQDVSQPSDPTKLAGQRYLLKPIPSRQLEESRRFIMSAAEKVKPGRAIVLGAGACEEIPLAELAARFEHLTLNDVNAQLLDSAIAAGLDEPARQKIDTQLADLTGLTQPVLEKITLALDLTSQVDSAINAMAQIVANEPPSGMSLSGRYDLIVASCVLSQLHVVMTYGAGDLFEKRFPGHLQQLRDDERWSAAIYKIARRMEAQFVDDLVTLLADDGLVYLSESVQMCYIELTATGQWQSEGTHRMLRTTDLADYVDRRFAIIARGRWDWVVRPPSKLGETGRLFDVQALILQHARAAN